MRIPAVASLLLALLPALPAAAPAFEALDDGELETVSGAGIAIGLDQFEFAMAPTSYFEQVGSAPATAACSGTGSVASNVRCWRRGDLRWYGVNISGAGNTGYHWNDATTCSAGSLDCPRGGVITNFSPYDNPYLIRAASPQGMAYNGGCINGSAGGCTGTPTSKAIYEFLAPTTQPDYTFSWWGEMESGSTRNSATQPLTTGTGNVLKSQNIIRGNAAGSVFRLFQFTETGNETFGMYYHSRLRGDYRLSVAQSSGSHTNDSQTVGQPIVFANTEGMYFRNVNAFVPLGQLYYQALTVRQVGTNGNFELVLTPLPNVAAVYNRHYALNAGDVQGYETARANNNGGATSTQYQLTHGFSRWGGWSGGTWTGRNLISSSDGSATGDGVIFRACIGCTNFLAFGDRPVRIDKRGETQSMNRVQNYNCATGNAGSCSTAAAGPITSGAGNSTRTFPTATVNLGDSRIEGLMFNSLRFESCGGSPTC